MKQLLLIVIHLFLINTISTAPRAKDRNNLPENVFLLSQNGTHNIQVHLKDFQIIALLSDESLGDYDYDYDYSDFTIKPNNLTTTTTPKPANHTTPVNNNAISTSTTPSSTQVPSEEPVRTTEKPDSIPQSSPDKIRVQILQSPILTDQTTTTTILQQSESLPEILHYKKCTSGFSRDKNGRCRRIRRPGVPGEF